MALLSLSTKQSGNGQGLASLGFFKVEILNRLRHCSNTTQSTSNVSVSQSSTINFQDAAALAI